MYPVIIDDIHRAVFPRFPYAAMYRIRDDKIEVLAVLHHKQHPDALLIRVKTP
jgi:plasmid stabilization system protein ParE